MKNYKKGFAVPIIIAIIALLVISGGAYYFFHKPTPSNLTNSEQQVEWKTYSNKDLGFSIQYPSQWEEPKLDVWGNGTQISFEKNAPLYIIESSQSQYGIEGQTFDVNNVVDKQEAPLSKQTNISDFKREKITVAGKEAVKVSYVSKGTPLAGTKSDAPAVTKQVVNVYMIPPNFGGVFVLSYEYPLSNDKIEESNFLGRIISSINFIENNAQTTSGIYTDSQYGSR